MHSPRTASVFRAVIRLALIATATQAQAAEWTGSARVAPAITYTDNVCLSKNNKQDDWIGTLTPSGRLEGKGRRASIVLDGWVQLNTLTNSALSSNGCGGNLGNREQFRPRIRGKFTTMLVDNWLDLNINARADQNEVTARAPGGDDDFNRTGNRNTYYRYSVSPVLNHRFKDWFRLNMRYTWDEQFNSSDVVRDSNRHAAVASISNVGSSRWSRKLEGRYTQVNYGENFNGLSREDTELSSLRLQLGYRFSRRWAVDGFYGIEDNNFQTTLKGDMDGTLWGVNAVWTPSVRTSVTVGTGERFFGQTPRLSIRHRHKRSEFTLDYRKSITFERDLRTGDLGGFEDNINNPSVFSNGPILDERVAAGWRFDGRRSTLNVRGNYSEQTRSEDGEVSVFKNVVATFSPRLSTRYNLSGSVTWREDEPRGRINELPVLNDRGQSETWTFGAMLSRRFNNRLSLSLNYRYTIRDGDSELNDYAENRITATLGITL